MEDYKEKIRNLYNKVRFSALLEDSYVAKKLEDVFPELKEESEEESFRRYIIKVCKETIAADDGGLELSMGTTKRLLALLEKQGNEPNWCHHKVDLSNCSEEYRKAYYDGWNNCNMQHSQCKSESNDVVKCLINGMKFYYEDNEDAMWGTEKFSMKVKDILSWLKKQGEQKSYASETMNEKGDFDNGFTRMMEKEQKPAKFSEQNHDWSEDDEYHIKSILSTIECCKAQFPNAQAVVEAYNADIDWLKSLKDRVQLLPKQEWSAEDVATISRVISIVKWAAYSDHSNPILNDEGATELVERLKSLIPMNNPVEWSMEDEEELEIALDTLKKAGQYSSAEWLKNVCLVPQSHWKPSDEQMEALADALSLAKNCGKESSFDLRTLLEQLKKLK